MNKKNLTIYFRKALLHKLQTKYHMYFQISIFVQRCEAGYKQNNPIIAKRP